MIAKPFALTNEINIGAGKPLVLIAGPCVIESRGQVLEIAEKAAAIADKLEMPYVFKSSFDKANRSSIESYRGPGLDEGMKILAEVKETFGIPTLTDIHLPEQAEKVAEAVDILQIPAFLCRQTDLLLAAAKTGKPVNVKKGQFLSPWDVSNIIGKIKAGGCERIMITERGTSFGYRNLVVDMKGIQVIRETGVPLVFDATHSVQLPGGLGNSSGGMREYIPTLAKAAVAAGADALFMEVHTDPDAALSDGPNMWPLDKLETLLKDILAVSKSIRD